MLLSNWSGPLTSNTTFSNSEVQNIVGNVDVEPGVTLTVQAGTVVQFNSGTSLTVDGTLIAQGTTSQTIDFTSVHDNSATGGSNTASPGNWNSIQFNSDSTGNVLTDTKISYGGGFGLPMVHDIGGPLTLSSSTVSDSAATGVRLEQSSATLNAVTFANNGGPAVTMDLDSNPTITGETPALISGNSNNGVLLDGGKLAENLNWTNPDIVYTLNGNVDVPKGITLTIGAGKVIKSGGASLTVDGTLTAQGTAAAPSSSRRSTTIRRAATPTMEARSPKPADWTGLQFNADSLANVLGFVDLYYGGGFGVPGIYDDGGPLALSNGSVNDCQHRPAIQSGTATLSNDSFQGNHGEPSRRMSTPIWSSPARRPPA